MGKEDCPGFIWTFVCGASDAENVDSTIIAECILAFVQNKMQ